ncbi:hypothetical protein [Austwickia chelonae]|uniref:Uncharacterized protein n=1 Tax=Austwickia chelonae NBRC 105200 TaxID=1184607 RepID=K6VK83_9MICO|nr:hypothetical protein [Austwickia chelonae]GAB77129.1 hypothetical protein AUCHE_05_00330 [Austwickia chelonae NBRC 105200]
MFGISPEMISAISGLGALFVATWAGITAFHIQQIERQRDAIAEKERLSSSATGVSAWTAIQLEGDIRKSGILLRNISTMPIYDVCISSKDRNGAPEPPIKLCTVPPGEYFIERVNTSYHWAFPDAPTGIIRPIMNKKDWAVAFINFTDSSGREWQREQNGSLTCKNMTVKHEKMGEAPPMAHYKRSAIRPA